MDSSSFAGGNVEDWTPFVAAVKRAGVSGIEDLPTTARMRFNFREMYLANEPIPR